MKSLLCLAKEFEDHSVGYGESLKVCKVKSILDRFLFCSSVDKKKKKHRGKRDGGQVFDYIEIKVSQHKKVMKLGEN